MSIKELTKTVETATGLKIRWELGKKYTAFNVETEEVVAIYNPKNGKLEIKNK